MMRVEGRILHLKQTVKLLASVYNEEKLVTTSELVVVVGALIFVELMNKLAVTGQAKVEVVMAETTVALLRIGGLESMAR
jgi:hypothetical protein